MVSSFTQVHNELAELLPAALLVHCEACCVKKGERLFLTGNKPTHMFYVGAGEIVLERLGQNGSWLVLQRARHGFVAEASLQSARYHCDARAVEKTELTTVAIEPLLAAMAVDAAFAARWIRMQSAELRRLRLQCERLALNRVQDRLIHLIETEGQGGVLTLGVGLKSFAAQLGVTHEALYRCVAGMEKAQLLRRVGGDLVLLSAVNGSEKHTIV
jgi:CRP-like cAMP-binding protein